MTGSVSNRRSRILGCGGHLPARIVANAEIEATLDTSDAWIRERTGIRQRHIAADGEKTSDLAIAAARAALADAGIEAAGIDLIVLATTTPDETCPATALRVQAELGCHGAIATSFRTPGVWAPGVTVTVPSGAFHLMLPILVGTSGF